MHSALWGTPISCCFWVGYSSWLLTTLRCLHPAWENDDGLWHPLSCWPITVTEIAQKGSLYNILHSKKPEDMLPFRVRMQIAKGAAQVRYQAPIHLPPGHELASSNGTCFLAFGSENSQYSGRRKFHSQGCRFWAKPVKGRGTHRNEWISTLHGTRNASRKALRSTSRCIQFWHYSVGTFYTERPLRWKITIHDQYYGPIFSWHCQVSLGQLRRKCKGPNCQVRKYRATSDTWREYLCGTGDIVV